MEEALIEPALTPLDLENPVGHKLAAALSIFSKRERGFYLEDSLDCLGSDSLDYVTFLSETESRFGIKISEEEVSQLLTVGEWFFYLQQNCAPTTIL